MPANHTQSQDAFERLFPEAAAGPTSEDAFARLFPEAVAPTVTNPERGGDFWTRFNAGLKVTEAGKLNYLRERYGKENVFVQPEDGSLVIRDPKTNQVFPFDPSVDQSFVRDIPGDLADIAGDVAEAAAGGISGVGGAIVGAAGGPLGAAAGAMIGGGLGSGAANVLRQGGSANIAGDDELTTNERARMASEATQMGATSELIARGVGQAFDVMRPANTMRRGIVGSDNLGVSAVPPGTGAGSGAGAKNVDELLKSAGTKEGTAAYTGAGKRLTKQTGVDLTVGQTTGSRTALKLEGLLAQRPGSEATMFESAVKQAQQLEGYLGKQIERLGNVGSEVAGERVAAAFDAFVGKLATSRSRIAGEIFGRADQLAGGKKVIPVRNAVAEIDRLIEDFSPNIMTDTAEKVVSGLERMRSKLLQKGTEDAARAMLDAAKAGTGPTTVKNLSPEQIIDAIRVSPKSFQRDLAVVGKAAAGSGNIVEDLGDKATQIHIARRMMRALQRDLDDAITSDATEVGATLKSAREAYRRLSEPIDRVRASILTKSLKLVEEGAPDKIAQRLVGNGVSNVQVRDAMKLLEKADPDAARNIRAAALQELLGKADSSVAMANRGVTLSPSRFASVARKNEERITALFGGDARGLLQFKRAVLVAQRIGDTAGVGPGGSQTAPMLFYRELLDAVVTGKINPQAAMGQVFGFMSANRMAKTMTSPEGRDAFLELAKLGQTKQAVAATLKRLASIQEREEKLERRRQQDRQEPETPAE